MRKLLARIVPALVICAAVAVVAVDRGWLASGPPAIGDVASMSESEAAAHRRNRYAEIASIEELMALPGHFARMEALYALAGRSDSADVQNLVFQASGIVDQADRRDTLLVLFTRLTELDPASALALSRTPQFGTDPAYEREVWQRWGEHDLDAALRHAAQLDATRRNFAAQALLASQGYWGNERTARIAQRLGVEPDDRTRSARLDELVRSDPAAAVAYVHGLESPLHRRQAAVHLGLLLGREGLDSADRLAATFRDDMLRGAFEDAAAQAAAEVDPAGTLARLFEQGNAVPTSRLISVFTAVARQDMGEALAWFEQLDDPRQTMVVGSVIAGQLTRTDPQRALAWAKSLDGRQERGIYRSVIATLAEIDPGFAMAEARSLDDPRRRMMAMATIAQQLSEQDPRRAVALLDDIESPRERAMLVQSIATNWLQRDPEAALGWILAADVSQRSQLVAEAGAVLANTDLDAAIRLLPRLDEQYATTWRQQIASRIASERSVAQAQSFIAQYQGSPEYPHLLGAVIQGVARNDAAAAARMLEDLPESENRWALFSSVYMHYSRQDPRGALDSLLSLDSGEPQRRNLLTQVVGRWANFEPLAAERWVANLAPGPQRDAAIAGAAGQWSEVTPSRRRMLESIDDPMARRQAVAGAVFRLARGDPEAAERLLREVDLPASDKAMLREQMKTISQRRSSSLIGVW